MAKTKQTSLVKRVVIIFVCVIAVCAAIVGLRQVYILNFAHISMVFSGYGFQTTNPVQVERITDGDMSAVTGLLKNNHISYTVNDDGTGIFVSSYKREDAINVLENSGLEFDGCLIT